MLVVLLYVGSGVAIQLLFDELNYAPLRRYCQLLEPTGFAKIRVRKTQ